MKSKTSPLSKPGSIRLLEVAFLALPLLALIPNFFIIPDLTFPGLATQEAVFTLAASIFAALGLIELVRAKGRVLQLPRERVLLIVLLMVFILWQVISLAWSPSPYDGVRVSIIWFGFAIFFLAGLTSMRQRMALALHSVLTLVCGVLAISLLVERAQYGDNMLGIFFNHGISSEILVTLLPLQLLNYLCNQKGWQAMVSLAVSGLSLLALMTAMRRGAVLAVVFILIAVSVAFATKQIKLASNPRLLIVVAILIVGACFVGVRYREAIIYRIEGATKLESAEGGLTTRLRTWITAWEMGKRNALIGVGNGGYPSLYGEYRRFFVSNPKYASVAAVAGPEDNDEIRSPLVHNEYLQLFVELGVVGVLLFAAFWLVVIRRLWKGRKTGEADSYWVWGALLGLIALGISSAFSSFSLRFTPGAFIVACVLAIGFAFAKPEAKSENELSVPKSAAIAAVVIGLILCLVFTARTYNVYASQGLQGRATLRSEQLDFNYYPDRPADNARLERRYKQVLELDSENAGAHLGYGLLLYQMGRPAEAIPHLEYAWKHAYNRPFGYVALAFACEATGDVPRATQLLADCVASFPQSAFTRAAYAEMLRKQGKIDQAREQQHWLYSRDRQGAESWENALRLKPEDAINEAKRRSLIAPNELFPQLAMKLVFWRAFHYLK
ncbi:MAG: O-antigen ligase family protein [Blastocatellia bacterium]